MRPRLNGECPFAYLEEEPQDNSPRVQQVGRGMFAKESYPVDSLEAAEKIKLKYSRPKKHKRATQNN